MAVDGEVIVLEQPVSAIAVQLERRVTNLSRDRDNTCYNSVGVVLQFTKVWQ